MEPVAPSRMFVFTRKNGSQAIFDAVVLVEYMLSSGDFSDPLTRTPFTKTDLENLDRKVASLGEERQSVAKASQNRVKYTSAKSDRDAILGLERYLGEQVCTMLDIIEQVNGDGIRVEEAEENILFLLPIFQRNFQLMFRTDEEFAEQCLKQFRSFLVGPPNRPIRNHHGFRDFVLSLVNMVSSHV